MTERRDIEQAIQALEAQRGTLNDAVIDVSVAALRRQLSDSEVSGQALKGERKNVTVIFADISGFTAMSENLDPEDVRRVINACFARLGAVIDQYNGHIDKFIGDEIMALFGAPVAHENDPERALRAALDMMMALEQFNVEYADSLPQPLALHFGINSGLVIAGGIGQRQDYSVLGDTVNLAARLEDLSETGEILVGEETHRRAAPLFDFEALPPVQLKGKTKPVQVYRLLRAKTVHGGQIRGIEGLYSPLVGRTDELARLNTVLERFYRNQGGVVSIRADAGMGKSRLVYELRQLSHQQPQGRHAYWAEGHALSHGENASYLMARDMLRHVLGVSLGASNDEVAQALRDENNRLLPDSSDNYPYLAYLLDLPLDQEDEARIKYLKGDALRQRISQAVQNLIRAKTHEAPLVLVWEDLHWADPSSLNLLDDLLPLTEDCPLLIFQVYRPGHGERARAIEQRSITDDPDDHLSIRLAPLTPAETGRMLSNLLGDCPLPEGMRNLIVEKTEGNPFYLEEVVRALLESGVISYSEDEPNCLVIQPELHDIKIPDTLQGVIMSRIDRLPPPTKRLLQVASVIGREFSYRVLTRVVDDGVEGLKQLETLDLIQITQRAPHLAYRFQHIFTRESIYNSLLHSDCRQLHQQVGEVLEELHTDERSDGDIPLVLAHHFTESGDKPRALQYLSRAAHNAVAVYANQEARALYDRALAMFEESEFSPDRWDLLAGRERILNRLGQRQQQAITLTIMQTLSTLLKDNERLATTHNRRSLYFDRISEYHAAVEAAEAGLRAARRSGNRHLEAESLNLLALAAWRRFDYPEVQRWATQALRALMVVGDPNIRITSLFHLGRASYRLGQYDMALEYIDAAQDLTRDIGNRDEEATSHLILGWIYQRLGQYDRAEQQFRTKLELRRLIGHRYGEAMALSHLGWLAYDRQQPEAGLDYCRRALDISRAIGDRENEAYALSGLALNYEQLGQLAMAEENYLAALTIQQEIGATTLVIFGQAGLARIALAQNDLTRAEERIKPVAAWIEAGNAQKFWDPWSIYQSAYEVLETLGETATAQSIMAEAHTVLQQRANEISDEELRRCFLEGVKVNREIDQARQGERSARYS